LDPSFRIRSSKFVFLALDALDSDAGLPGETGVQRLIGLVVPGRVEIQHLLLRLHAGEGEGERESKQRTGEGETHVEVSSQRGERMSWLA
jgi:hypothetical protein